ncbi:MAG: DNA polymerase III subunit delta [Nitrospirae bacterium]|nr:DNA polymerase III subunit delta [Nitrospirota bacterium]
MSIKQFQQELDKNLPSSVYALNSSEGFLLYEALSAIKERYQDDNALNYHLFDMISPDDSKPIEQILDTLNTLPFLSDRRIIIINNLQKLPKKDYMKLDGYLANPSSASLLIMLHEDAPQKRLNLPPSKAIKTIALRVGTSEIPFWIRQRAGRIGIQLTDAAVEYLIDYTGADLGMLSSEIEKLASLNAAQILDVDDIKGLAHYGSAYTAFDLAKALIAGDAKKAFRIFESVNRMVRTEDMLGALNWQYSTHLSGAGGGKGYFRKVIRLLHEADIANKTSRNCVMEDLFVKLLRQPNAP